MFQDIFTDTIISTGLFEAYDQDAHTTVLPLADGTITEGPGENIFVVKDGTLATPDRGMFEGITRRTVTEIAAVGAAAVFVPFPHAVDDHQTTNAQFLVDAGGGWLAQQADLTPRWLADMLLNTERPALVERALKAKTMQKTQATREVVSACEELAA